jgi:hypothetical protein
MADYCTTTDVKLNPDLGISSTDVTSYDGVLSALITAASRLIDEQVGKWPNYFYPSTDTEIRYYNAFDGYCLDIDEAVSITEVAVSEGGEVTSTGYTVWAATDYILAPYNYARTGEPIRQIEVDTLNGNEYGFSRYPKGNRITGIFGYSATPPEEIKRACIIQTVSMFMQDKQGWRDAGASAELGQMVYTKNIHPVAAEILQQYKNKAIV